MIAVGPVTEEALVGQDRPDIAIELDAVIGEQPTRTRQQHEES
jgi:hypothetical protein